MCERCRSARGTDTAHLIRRTYSWTRCELDNLALLCRYCHTDIDSDYEMLEAFAVDRLGQERWDELWRKARDPTKPPLELFWESQRNYLRALL